MNKQEKFRKLIALRKLTLPKKQLYDKTSQEVKEFLESKPKTKREKEIDKDYTF